MRAGQVRQGTHIVEAGRKQQDGAPTAVAGTAGHTEAGERIALVRGDTVEPLVVALHKQKKHRLQNSRCFYLKESKWY